MNILNHKKIVFLGFFLAMILFFFLFFCSGTYSGVQFSQEKATEKILLEGKKIVTDSQSYVKVDGSTLIITQGGTYRFSGNLEDGQIIIEIGDEEEATLELNGVNIYSNNSSPIWVKSAGKVKIKLKKGTKNTLSDSSLYEKVSDGDKQQTACIYARSDLIIKGKGSLLVNGNYKHGIYSSDDLRVNNGNLTVKSRKTALKGKKSVQILGGNVSLQSDQDGIQSSDSVIMTGGNVSVHASRYGIYGRKQIEIRKTCLLTVENAKSPVAGIGKIQLDRSLEEITGKTQQ